MFLNRTQIQQLLHTEGPATENQDMELSPLAPHHNIKIKCIILNNKRIDGNNEQATINPQQVACIITERVYLDKSNIGFLYQKQKNYREGLWIIEPDVIHPGYIGHLRVHIVNMSKIERHLFVGDDVLEMFAYKNSSEFTSFPGKEVCYDDYVKKCMKEESMYADTFMNLDGHAERIAKIMFPWWMKLIAGLIGVFLLVPGVLSIYSYFSIHTVVGDVLSVEKVDVATELQSIKKQLNELKRSNK